MEGDRKASKLHGVREFAELAGVTVKALHHYDRLGLLKPRRRTDAGYRLYHEHDLERLEQIVALKFLGLTLEQIRMVLDRTPLALADALRMQRHVLEERQRLLGRALQAIQVAERALEAEGPADPSILRRLIEVINMEQGLDVMKKYFSDAAWVKARPRYEVGPSEEWKSLYREVNNALGEDPEGATGRALAARWMELVARESGNDPEVQAGGVKAWIDRANWPATLRERLEEFNLVAVTAFIGKAIAAHRQKYYAPEAWAKLSERPDEERLRTAAEWHALIVEASGMLGEDPASERVQALATRWLSLAGDPQMKAGSVAAWSDRDRWPEWMKAQAASLNLEEIGQFIGRAIACAPH